MGKRPNGTGSVYKEGNKWVAVWTDPLTHKRRKKRGFLTKKDAVLFLEELSKPVSKAKISQLWETYEATSFQDLSADKQRHYRSVYERLEGIWNVDIDQLTILDLQALIEPYNSYYSQKDIKTVLSHLYKIAIAEQILQINLTQYMRLKKHEEKEGEAWTEEEMNTFWVKWYEGDRFVGYILVMCYCGAMPAEIRQITRYMIHYDTHTIEGAGLKTNIRKKTPMFICDKIEPGLKTLMSDSMVLWHGSKQKFYDEYYRCINRCQVRELPPYSCRHTTATLLAEKTSPFTVQKVMRHSLISTTAGYVHPVYKTELEAVNKL